MSFTSMTDYVARAFFGKPKVDLALKVEYNEKGRPKVYVRRWFILAAYSLSYFMWNLSNFRQTALISEYALYFNTTNEFSAPPEYGIDFMPVLSSFVLIFTYPLAGKLVDQYGLKMMNVGSVGVTIGVWWWYFSFENYESVLFARFLASVFGVMFAASLLRVTHNWFPKEERATAIAIGALVSTIGAGCALVVGPAFSTGELEINFELKSCLDSFKEQFDFNISNVEDLSCSDEAADDFCCAAETDIDGLNFFVAAVTTCLAIFTILVVKDSPATPPSRAGIVREGPGFKKALSLMFSHSNYRNLCFADFFASGPPIVVFSTIDRILPGSVTEYAALGVAVTLVVSLPLAGIFAKTLARNHKFYEMTRGAYTAGFIAYAIVAVVLLIDNDELNYLSLILGCGGLVIYMMWTVSVYELKMEYVFSEEFALQGYIVAIDRSVINLASAVYVAAIPPERFNGDLINGRQFTFLVGSASMALGVAFVLFAKNKRLYLRQKYENVHGSVGEIEDDLEILEEKLRADDELDKKLEVKQEADVKVMVVAEGKGKSAGEAGTDGSEEEKKEVKEVLDEKKVVEDEGKDLGPHEEQPGNQADVGEDEGKRDASVIIKTI